MIQWSEEEIHIVNLALYSWLVDEEELIENIQSSRSLSLSEKELMINSSNDKVVKIKKIVDKLNKM